MVEILSRELEKPSFKFSFSLHFNKYLLVKLSFLSHRFSKMNISYEMSLEVRQTGEYKFPAQIKQVGAIMQEQQWN